jgi:SAM-dependent methyltransferase
MEKNYRFVKCDLCGSNDYRLYGVSPEPEKAIHFQVVRCHRCGLIYALPQATEETLRNLYDFDYPDKVLPSWEMQHSRTQKMRLDIEALGKPGKICEIGCGIGIRLKLAQEMGWEVFGVEPSEIFAKYAKGICGEDKIWHGTIYNSGLTDNYFDIVLLWHVLEHVDSPTKYLRKIFRILKPGGRVIIGVPNGGDPIHRLRRLISLGKSKSFADFGEHTYTFTCRTLLRFLKKVDFSILEIKPYYSSGDRGLLHYRHPVGKILGWLLHFLPNFGPLLSGIAKK